MGSAGTTRLDWAQLSWAGLSGLRSAGLSYNAQGWVELSWTGLGCVRVGLALLVSAGLS